MRHGMVVSVVCLGRVQAWRVGGRGSIIAAAIGDAGLGWRMGMAAGRCMRIMASSMRTILTRMGAMTSGLFRMGWE